MKLVSRLKLKSKKN
jgi:Ribonuclease G/E